jgi:uncharacterized protein YbjQ (UPF0145 family)
MTAARPVPALSDLSVTEFLSLSRMGFLPHGLVIGSSVVEANTQQGNVSLWDALFGNPQMQALQAGEVVSISEAVRAARMLAIQRMMRQAADLGAEGIVGVRLTVEHHLWRGGHQVAKFVAMGTAVGFDHAHGPTELRGAPPLRLADGAPFTSTLSGHDFVALLRAGYRPITVASGTCVYQLDPREVVRYRGYNVEIGAYTQAFFDARETAMSRLQADLFAHWPPGHPDAPVGIVGMSVSESAHRQQLRGQSFTFGFSPTTSPVVEFTAVGTAIAALRPDDPRRSREQPKPRVVVPLDR